MRNKSKGLQRAREVTQSSKHGTRRANPGIKFEKNRSHRATRRKGKIEIRNIEDGNHNVQDKIEPWNIY